MMFIRGRDAAGTLTAIPVGFLGDLDSGGADAPYTDWGYQRNDPYLTNSWVVTNRGTKNNGQPGDVIISWFKPLDESFDGADYTNEVYLMVVNALTDISGSATDCLQQIELNFHSSLAAVEMLNPLTGIAELQLLPLTNGLRRLVLNLNGGDAALFKFSDGAPFVGTQLTPVTGPPVITIHPASRANVPGTDASFTVRATGSGPLSYQWQFEGINLPGATTNNYTRSQVQTGDLGRYTVVVSNAFGMVTSTPAALTLAVSTPLLYEPFDYSNIGSPVTENTSTNWTYGGSGGNDFMVAGGNLSYTGLAASIGNSATNGGAGPGVRRLFGTNFNSGKVFFSALFRMNQLGYGAGGWSGAATQVGALTANDNTSFRLAVMVKSNSPSGYVIGVQKGGTGATPTFDTTEFHAGETVFLVGQYDFTTSPNAVTLWINPNASTLGYFQPPASGAIFSNSGTDSSTLTIDRFNFRQNTAASVPAAVQWDELRIANSWFDVTPPAVGSAPQITSQPTNRTVSVGSTVTFSVGANGTSPLSYQWRFNGTNLAGATDSVCTRTNAQRYHAGTYSVVVTNSFGTISSSNGLLLVTPVLPVVLRSASQLNGRFSFQGTGDPGAFAIETSTNLVDWSEQTNVFSATGTFEFVDWLSNAPKRYFRARLVP